MSLLKTHETNTSFSGAHVADVYRIGEPVCTLTDNTSSDLPPGLVEYTRDGKQFVITNVLDQKADLGQARQRARINAYLLWCDNEGYHLPPPYRVEYRPIELDPKHHCQSKCPAIIGCQLVIDAPPTMIDHLVSAAQFNLRHLDVDRSDYPLS